MEKEKQGEQEVKLPKPILLEDLGMMFATENSNQKRHYGIFKCGLCGEEFRTRISKVKSGDTKSCGCYNKRRVSETHKTHGFGYTRLYAVWGEIKRRTLNPKHNYYNDYGGRGITICDEWKNDFMSFHDWAISNGYSDELSIDRIDNDGSYYPENCRWTTRTIQSRNTRIHKSNKSGYRGVAFRKDNNNFRVTITVNKKRINLGSFKTAIEGAIAYNNYIIKNNLEGFILNKIPQESFN